MIEYRIDKTDVRDKAVVVCKCGTIIIYSSKEKDHPKYCFECEKIELKKLNMKHKKLDSFGVT